MCLSLLFRGLSRSASRSRPGAKPKQQLCSEADRQHASRRTRKHHTSAYPSQDDSDLTEPLLSPGRRRRSSAGSNGSGRSRNRASTHTLRGQGKKRDPPKSEKPTGSGDRDFKSHKRLPRHTDLYGHHSQSGRSRSRPVHHHQSQQRAPANSRRRLDPLASPYPTASYPQSQSVYYGTHEQASSFALRAATNRELERARREAQILLHNYTRPAPSWSYTYHQPGIPSSSRPQSSPWPTAHPNSRNPYYTPRSGQQPYSRRLERRP